MTRRLGVLLIPVLATLLVLPEASAARTEKVVTRTYQVTGSTVEQVRASLEANGPGDYHATTSWRISYRYRYAFSADECRVTSRKVHTKIVYLYPSWTPPAEASQALRDKWTNYFAALESHEEGHGRTGRITARRVDRMIGRAAATSCPALEKQITRSANRLFKRGNAMDVRYDAETDHGATQGAIFRPMAQSQALRSR